MSAHLKCRPARRHHQRLLLRVAYAHTNSHVHSDFNVYCYCDSNSYCNCNANCDCASKSDANTISLFYIHQ